MRDRQTELERQVSDLAVEIARLRRLVIICFASVGVILIAGFIDRDLPLMIASIGAVVWALGYLCVTVGSSLHRYFRKREHDVA